MKIARNYSEGRSFFELKKSEMSTPSFSTIASAGISKKLPTKEEFPALGKSREQVLISELLGKRNNQFGIGMGSQNSFPSQGPSAEGNDKFGMLGLIDTIRMSNPDKSTLSLGLDLTTLGLGLNGQMPIHSMFMTPFSDQCLGQETPVFQQVLSYSRLPTLSHSPLSRFKVMQDESLFYIFYSMPRDVMQEGAAQELYSRGWRFHKEFKLWLVKDPSSASTLEQTKDYERGIFIFFDPASWSRVKLERLVYFDHLEERVKL